MSVRETRENVLAFGHENVQATHPSTIMFTRENHLSKTGDCIVAVAANKAVANLSSDFKDKLRKQNAKLIVIIEVDGLIEQVNASGSPKLILTHPTDMVIRKSNYICSRTLAIQADKTANDLPRTFVEKLKSRQNEVKLTLIVTN